MEPNRKAMLDWNVLEFVKSLSQFSQNIKITHATVPGGNATIEEAVRQKLIVVTKKEKDGNRYKMTLDGLMLLWTHSHDDELIVHEVVEVE